MMKTPASLLLSSLICLLLCSNELLAQKEPVPVQARNAVYLELGGNAAIYSLNYDRIIYEKGIFKAAARAGICAIPYNIANKNYGGYLMPFEIVGLLGKSKHHLEMGPGITPYWIPFSPAHGSDGESDSYALDSHMSFRLGYRYQKPEGGFFFRIAYTPIVNFKSKQGTYALPLFGGLSVGKSF